MDLTGIDFLGIDRVLKRGTGEVIGERDGALLVHDRVSGAYMLGCEDAAPGAAASESSIQLAGHQSADADPQAELVSRYRRRLSMALH